MDKKVLKKVCEFLQSQKDNEAFFSHFWEKTKEFYPDGQSKTKVKEWLQQHNERIEIIANKDGNPFGKIKLKVQAECSDLPSTTKRENAEITQKLIESIDNKDEHGHLYAIICKNKAQIFPAKLQDKKYIRKWLQEHEDLFKIVKDAHGGVFSVEVMEKARKSMRGRSQPPTCFNPPLMTRFIPPLMTRFNPPPMTRFNRPPMTRFNPPPMTRFNPPLMTPAAVRGRQVKATSERKAESQDHFSPLAKETAFRISQTIENEGGTIPFDDLLGAKPVIFPFSDAESLKNFLGNFSSIFEVINIEDVGEWVRLKDVSQPVVGHSDAVTKVITYVLQNGGTVPFANLVKNAPSLIDDTINNPDKVEAWLKENGGPFDVVPKTDGSKKPLQVKVKLGFYPRFCQHYVAHGKCEKKNCQFLHICKAHICQPSHSDERCELSHNVRDAHNKVIIDKMQFLGKETDKVVVEVLRKSCFPRVCMEYNKNVTCPRGEKCYFLHVCGNYVLNQCSGCLLSHNVADDLHNIEVLKKYALLPSKKLSEEIVKANIAFAKPSLSQPKEPQPAEKSVEVKKKKRNRTRRRRRKSSQASSTVDNDSSGETDSSGSDVDEKSVASSTHNTKPQPLLSSDNIMKSNLALSLTGHEKVENWMGVAATLPSPVQAQTQPQSDSSSSVSVQSSVVSTQSSLWQDDLQKKVFITILERYNGIAPFNKISKDKDLFELQVDVAKWFAVRSQCFLLHRNGQGKIDSVSAFSLKSRVCLDYSGRRGCSKTSCGFLHICRDHVERRCTKGNACDRNHKVNHEQVTQTVKRVGLQDLSESQLLTLIRVSIPTVCQFHNQAHCNRGDFCPNLHVCKQFIQRGRCSGKDACKYGHEEALKQKPATEILKMYRLFGKQPNYKYIQKMIFVFDTKKQRKGVKAEANSENQGETAADGAKALPSSMDVDLITFDNSVQDSDEVTPNICYFALIGECHRKWCSNVHSGLPYMWQLKLEGHSAGGSKSWLDFDQLDCESIEKYFCDANCNATALNTSTKIPGAESSNVLVDFESLSVNVQCSGKSFKMRRLECKLKNTSHESETWCQTQWTWYKKDQASSKWIQYESNKLEAFEDIYQEGVIQIEWSSMRRRPAVFVAKKDMDDKMREREEQEMSETLPAPLIPCSPVTMETTHQASVDEDRASISFPRDSTAAYRARVEPRSPEYQSLVKQLCDSIGTGLVINHIERVVNGDLWNNYIMKKKSMTDKLQPGEDLRERDLFLPCKSADVERVMNGNVQESTIMVPRPYGPGHYFASQPSLCLQWCEENLLHSRFLIVCKVLVGAWGLQGRSEFPRRPDGRLYDSVVDNVDEPQVFVIRDVNQCYPSHIIDFTCSASSVNDIEQPFQELGLVDSNYGSTAQPQPVYSPVSPVYPLESTGIHASAHLLPPPYVPPNTNISHAVPLQPPITSTSSMEYVKAAPPYSGSPCPQERAPPQPPTPPQPPNPVQPPTHAQPPPAYTRFPDPIHSTERGQPSRNVGDLRAGLRPPGNAKNDKEKCLVM